MAVDMFMVIPNIKGETQDKVYKDKNGMDVLSWSWGVSNSGSAHYGSGAGAGKANVADLTFMKWVDKATCDLLLACCKGTHFDKAELIVRKAGDTPLEYLKITMTEVMVTSVSTGGSGGQDRLSESVTLNFAKVQVDYKSQAKTGAVDATPTMTWNIAENA